MYEILNSVINNVMPIYNKLCIEIYDIKTSRQGWNKYQKADNLNINDFRQYVKELNNQNKNLVC